MMPTTVAAMGILKVFGLMVSSNMIIYHPEG